MSAELSWNPTLRLPLWIDLRGHLGVFPLKGRTVKENDRFIGSEFAVLAGLRLLDPLLMEAGLGAQEWHEGRSRLGPMALANVAIRLSRTHWLERVFAGVGVYDSTRGNTGMIRLGVGIRL